MGINISRQTDLGDNEYLKRFVGKAHIPATDTEFWTGFLQYHIALPSNRCVCVFFHIVFQWLFQFSMFQFMVVAHL